MDLALGPATWFCTLSCAEYRWEDTQQLMRERNPDLSNASRPDVTFMCNKDPVSLAQQFFQRWQKFETLVLKSKDENGPLGYVENYYYRYSSIYEIPEWSENILMFTLFLFH